MTDAGDEIPGGEPVRPEVSLAEDLDFHGRRRIKQELLMIPISAWSRAIARRDQCQANGNLELAALYQAVADELAAEGYSPDPSTGMPGPAVMAYYNQVVDPVRTVIYTHQVAIDPAGHQE